MRIARVARPLLVGALLAGVGLGMAACATREPAKSVVAVAESGPDRRPLVTAAEARSDDLRHLQPGETVIAGTDLDTTAPLVNRVELRFRRAAEPEPLVPPEEPRLVAFKYLLGDEGQVASGLTLDLDESDGSPIDRTLRLLILNVGDAPYQGRLVAHERLDPALTFRGIRAFSRVEDQRDYKRRLGSIPLVRFYAATLDDFLELPTAAQVQAAVRDDLISFRTDALSLAPQEGVWIDYGVEITPPDGPSD